MPAPAETEPAPARPEKSAAAFRTISEVAGDLGLPQHVLRFWESKFPVIKPLKRGGGRRYYRPEDVALLKRIRDLLHNDGYTIRGVQKLLRESGGKLKPAAAAPQTAPEPAAKAAPPVEGGGAEPSRRELKTLLRELEDIRASLGGA